jgi:hypothetical protein
MSTIIETIVRDLRELPPPQLMEVSRFIHSLNSSAESAQRRRMALRSTAGCMTGVEGETFEKNVREIADRIDVDE